MKKLGEDLDVNSEILPLLKQIRKELDELTEFMKPRLAADKKIFDVKNL